jgi:hypothetical protein
MREPVRKTNCILAPLFLAQSRAEPRFGDTLSAASEMAYLDAQDSHPTRLFASADCKLPFLLDHYH